MTVDMSLGIPCRYFVLQFIDDPIRDETVNVGVLLQSEVNYHTLFWSILDYPIAAMGTDFFKNIDVLIESLRRIQYDLSRERRRSVVDEVISKFEDDEYFRFTESRGTLATNVISEIESLYERFVDRKPLTQFPRKLERLIEYVKVPNFRNAWIQNEIAQENWTGGWTGGEYRPRVASITRQEGNDRSR